MELAWGFEVHPHSFFPNFDMSLCRKCAARPSTEQGLVQITGVSGHHH